MQEISVFKVVLRINIKYQILNIIERKFVAEFSWPQFGTLKIYDIIMFSNLENILNFGQKIRQMKQMKLDILMSQDKED